MGTLGYFEELGGTLGVLQGTFGYFGYFWVFWGTLGCFEAICVLGCTQVYLGVLKGYVGVLKVTWGYFRLLV